MECSKHPRMDTMVPCMKCGRPFCRLCSSHKGGVHYCPDCSAEMIKDLQEKGGVPADIRASVKKKDPLQRPGPEPVTRQAPTPTLKKEVPGASQGGGGKRWILGLFLKPFKRLKDSIPHPLAAARGRMGAESLQERITENRLRKIREREERRAVKVVRGEHRSEALAERAASARERAASSARRAAGRARDALVKALMFVPRKMLAAVVGAYRRFPVGLVETDMNEEAPLLREKWKLLLLITVGGAALWVALVLVVRDRWILCGCVVGLAVGAGFVKAMDGLSRDTGLFAGTATVLSIIAGELIVQLLFSLRIMKNIGITERVMARTYSTWGFYANFFWWFVLGILLPSGILAFLIGAWPFPKRLYWRGFGIV